MSATAHKFSLTFAFPELGNLIFSVYIYVYIQTYIQSGVITSNEMGMKKRQDNSKATENRIE